MPNFQMPIERPEEIKPRLGKLSHWKEGRSAFELTTSWMTAGGFPDRVREVLDQAPEWRDAQLLDAIFERETQLPGNGAPSQSDLVAVVRVSGVNAILAVEGKVDEPFGTRLREWLQGEPVPKSNELPVDAAQRARSKANRAKRFESLCGMLGVGGTGHDDLYYQLFHRTCAAVIEANRFQYTQALMLVHSFTPLAGGPRDAGFEAFAGFAKTIGMPVTKPGTISEPKAFTGLQLRLGWASDRASA
jgi:hypothetical protein